MLIDLHYVRCTNGDFVHEGVGAKASFFDRSERGTGLDTTESCFISLNTPIATQPRKQCHIRYYCTLIDYCVVVLELLFTVRRYWRYPNQSLVDAAFLVFMLKSSKYLRVISYVRAEIPASK